MMGEAELDKTNGRIIITSHIITYGNAASEEVTQSICEEIEMMWNAPKGSIFFKNDHFDVIFRITGETKRDIDQLEVLQNTDAKNNYFRIEEFIHGNISFVDGLGCNTGFFLLENLYKGSTTAAHEYGHTLGLDHPAVLDIRGHGVPGIMYPRGTLVDPQFQYDPTIPAGRTGGTMHPMHRRVKKEDIEDLKLHKLFRYQNKTIIGGFTNIYHWPHIQFKDTKNA